MEQLQEFFAMGEYGAYVWPAYGASALVLGWLLVSSLRRLRGLERALAAQGIAQPGKGGKGRGDKARGDKGRGSAGTGEHAP
jgi:heme exporter protein CcmD